MGINVQVCWEKLANYWDVEMRLVPMEGDRFHLSAEEAWPAATRTPSAWWPSSGRPSTVPMSRCSRSARPAFALQDGIDNFTVFDVSAGVREGGWQLPAYTFPEHRTDLAVLRVVVRRGFTHDTADLLLRDLRRLLPRLRNQPEPVHDGTGASGFHH